MRDDWGYLLFLVERKRKRGEVLPLYSMEYSTVQYCTVQYCTVQYSAVQYSAVLYSAGGEGEAVHRGKGGVAAKDRSVGDTK